MNNNRKIEVLFVCLGNICRSPTAYGVFEKHLAESDLAEKVSIDSAGTAAYHIGKAPDKRAIAMAKGRGYDLSRQRARQVSEQDFDRFDLILAMDDSNIDDLLAIRPANSRAEVRLFLSFDATSPITEVPDPYYGGNESFEHVVDLVESASKGLLKHLHTLV